MFIRNYLNACSRILVGVDKKAILSERNRLSVITKRLRDNGIGPSEQSELEDSLAEYHKRILQFLREAETEVNKDNLMKARELLNCASNIENERKLLKYKIYGGFNVSGTCKLCGGMYPKIHDR